MSVLTSELNLQVENLTKLAHYLLALPKDYSDFHMGAFSKDTDRCMDVLKASDIYGQTNLCGTSGCAIGHAPLVEGLPKPEDHHCWAHYSDIVTFGVNSNNFMSYHLSENQNNVWEFMFGGRWTDYDNTPHGAGKRILFALHKLENNVFPYEFDEDCNETVINSNIVKLYNEWYKTQHTSE